jgi:hypothetical protein
MEILSGLLVYTRALQYQGGNWSRVESLGPRAGGREEGMAAKERREREGDGGQWPRKEGRVGQAGAVPPRVPGSRLGILLPCVPWWPSGWVAGWVPL